MDDERRVRRVAIIVTVCLLGTGVPRASAGPVASVRITSAQNYCHAARTVNGWYTARHCLRYPGGLVTFAGSRQIPPCSVDPVRDLGHCAGAPAPITLRAPVQGETATGIMGTRKPITYTYQRLVPGEVWDAMRTKADYELWCWTGGRQPLAGDSGGGLYADSDDALVGVLTNAGDVNAAICPSGWAALASTVP